MNWQQIVVGILVLGVLVILNAFLYKANKNTPEPEGCEQLRHECSHCPIEDCGGRKQPTEEENSKEK